MKYYADARVKFPVTDTHVYISPVMLLFLLKTGIHHFWLSNLITGVYPSGRRHEMVSFYHLQYCQVKFLVNLIFH